MDINISNEQSDIEFICTSADFNGDAAALIYESSHELLDFMFSNRECAIDVLTKLHSYPGGHFGKQFVTLLIFEGKVSGVELGYNRQQMSSQDLPGVINLLRASPIRIWPHLIGDVRKALHSYVPLPSSDAYYINNLAITTSTRRQGFGRLMLTRCINNANKNGLNSIELDVTEPNTNAIKFYERNGFSNVSTSGAGDSESLYRLPKLLRMRLEIKNG